MTDKEWIKGIKHLTNKELLDDLEYCGHDSYYDDIYKAVIKEIRRRLKNRRTE